MKFIKKIIAILLIALLSIANVIASGIPDEPMIIYGNVSGNYENNLKIYDWNNNLLKEIIIKSWKYWTNKTFSSDKIKLNTFNWELKFKIWNKTAKISKWEISICNNFAIFQKWLICQYNLSFQTNSWNNQNNINSWEINSNSKKHSSGWKSKISSKKYNLWKLKISNSIIEKDKKQNIIKKININNITKKETNINIKKFNIKKIDIKKYNWKKFINSKLKIKSKTYIKNLRNFNKKIKIEENVLWFKLIKIKWDTEYNKKVDYYKKKIIKDIKLNWIRESLLKHLNKMSITYWINKYNDIDWETKNFYNELLAEDINNFLFKMVKLKQKDEIINKTLERRRLEELKNKIK